ncbi:hypothetical protein DL767_009020 [Monosporascus sp. MG133]|nr:hypothetical protein DL767_009020 [Monosporascus sp. MG133]
MASQLAAPDLELEGGAGCADDGVLDLGGADAVVAVGHGDTAGGALVPGAAELVVRRFSDSLAVDAVEWLLDAGEDVALGEDVGALARVDAVADVLVVVVEQVGRAEADRRHARVEVQEEVVGIRHRQVAGVLGAVAVRVPHQRRLPVVVQERVAHRHEVRAVRDVDEAVVLVLVGLAVALHVAVVDPDVLTE